MSLLILTVILALLTATSSILEIERSSKFYKAKIIFVAIFFLGTAIASIFQFRLSEAESIKANKKDSAFAKSQSDIIQLQKINKRESDSLDKVIISLSSKLNSKSENILNQSRNIFAYTTGGEDNKPYIQLHFIKNNSSSYDVHFMVVNPGKYPLSHFSYDLTDMESEMFEFSKLNNLNPYDLNKAQQDEKEKFDQVNIKNSFHNGSIGNIPAKSGQNFYTGKLHYKSSFANYLIRVFWNNNFYDLTVSYALNSKDEFSLSQYIIWDQNKNKYSSLKDLKRFFPLIDKNYWLTFPKIKDSNNGIYFVP